MRCQCFYSAVMANSKLDYLHSAQPLMNPLLPGQMKEEGKGGGERKERRKSELQERRKDQVNEYTYKLKKCLCKCMYLDLFNSRSLKSQVKTVVCQAANLLTVSIIAHADDWYLGVLYQ